MCGSSEPRDLIRKTRDLGEAILRRKTGREGLRLRACLVIINPDRTNGYSKRESFLSLFCGPLL